MPLTKIDKITFLIERYGYARQQGSHQGLTSAEWMAKIQKELAKLFTALDDLQAVYRQDLAELDRLRGNGGWDPRDEAMAFGKDY